MKLAEPAIFELLKTLCSGRVYKYRAPQNAVAPFIVFEQTETERWRTLEGPTGMASSTFTIDVFASTGLSAEQTAKDIEEILDGYRGIVYYGSDSPQDFVRIASSSLQNNTLGIDQTEEPFLYQSSATYTIIYEQ